MFPRSLIKKGVCFQVNDLEFLPKFNYFNLDTGFSNQLHKEFIVIFVVFVNFIYVKI